MLTPLPHLDRSDPTPLEELVARLQGEPDEDEVYLAASHGFWEPEDREHFESTYAAYQTFFAETVARLTAILGVPDFRGTWEAADFPDWAHGSEIAIWSQVGSPLWLRIEHEDRELPILIALARVPDEVE